MRYTNKYMYNIYKIEKYKFIFIVIIVIKYYKNK